jgi:hypothetical protein
VKVRRPFRVAVTPEESRFSGEVFVSSHNGEPQSQSKKRPIRLASDSTDSDPPRSSDQESVARSMSPWCGEASSPSPSRKHMNGHTPVRTLTRHQIAVINGSHRGVSPNQAKWPDRESDSDQHAQSHRMPRPPQGEELRPSFSSQKRAIGHAPKEGRLPRNDAMGEGRQSRRTQRTTMKGNHSKK